MSGDPKRSSFRARQRGYTVTTKKLPDGGLWGRMVYHGPNMVTIPKEILPSPTPKPSPSSEG